MSQLTHYHDQLDADFSETLPTESTNDCVAYICLTTKDITRETDFLLSPILIAKYQGLDKTLKHKCSSKTNDNFSMTKLEGIEVTTYQGKYIFRFNFKNAQQLGIISTYRTQANHKLKQKFDRHVCGRTCVATFRHSVRHVVLVNYLRSNVKSKDTYHQRKQKKFRGTYSNDYTYAPCLNYDRSCDKLVRSDRYKVQTLSWKHLIICD